MTQFPPVKSMNDASFDLRDLLATDQAHTLFPSIDDVDLVSESEQIWNYFGTSPFVPEQKRMSLGLPAETILPEAGVWPVDPKYFLALVAPRKEMLLTELMKDFGKFSRLSLWPMGLGAIFLVASGGSVYPLTVLLTLAVLNLSKYLPGEFRSKSFNFTLLMGSIALGDVLRFFLNRSDWAGPIHAFQAAVGCWLLSVGVANIFSSTASSALIAQDSLDFFQDKNFPRLDQLARDQRIIGVLQSLAELLTHRPELLRFFGFTTVADALLSLQDLRINIDGLKISPKLMNVTDQKPGLSYWPFMDTLMMHPDIDLADLEHLLLRALYLRGITNYLDRAVMAEIFQKMSWRNHSDEWTLILQDMAVFLSLPHRDTVLIPPALAKRVAAVIYHHTDRDQIEALASISGRHFLREVKFPQIFTYTLMKASRKIQKTLGFKISNDQAFNTLNPAYSRELVQQNPLILARLKTTKSPALLTKRPSFMSRAWSNLSRGSWRRVH